MDYEEEWELSILWTLCVAIKRHRETLLMSADSSSSFGHHLMRACVCIHAQEESNALVNWV
jgi:hypothetical protein